MMAARVLSPKKISLVKSPIAIEIIVPCYYDGAMTQDLSLAIRAAKDAGRIIRKAYGKSKIIMNKGANDCATETDVQAEHAIIAALQEKEYSFLGEETGIIDRQSHKKWIVDPLDGTLNFVRGFPFFAVSIALIEDDKELVLGVVYDPIADECYWAERGEGAFMNDRKISVSQTSGLESAVLLIDHGKSEKHKKEYLRSLHSLMLNQGADVLRQGATALMLCHMAKGSFDAFLSCGDELYDYAAGLIIAKEAGASISDWEGNAWDIASSSLLAANGAMRRNILSRIAEHGKNAL